MVDARKSSDGRCPMHVSLKSIVDSRYTVNFGCSMVDAHKTSAFPRDQRNQNVSSKHHFVNRKHHWCSKKSLVDGKCKRWNHIMEKLKTGNIFNQTMFSSQKRISVWVGKSFLKYFSTKKEYMTRRKKLLRLIFRRKKNIYEFKQKNSFSGLIFRRKKNVWL